jgi:hypothetical protein
MTHKYTVKKWYKIGAYIFVPLLFILFIPGILFFLGILVFYIYNLITNFPSGSLIEYIVVPVGILLIIGFSRYIKIVARYCIMITKLKDDQSCFEFSEEYIKFKKLSDGYRNIPVGDILRLNYFNWGTSYPNFLTLFIKTKDFQIHLPIEGLNEDKYIVLDKLISTFPDKFKDLF